MQPNLHDATACLALLPIMVFLKTASPSKAGKTSALYQTAFKTQLWAPFLPRTIPFWCTKFCNPQMNIIRGPSCTCLGELRRNDYCSLLAMTVISCSVPCEPLWAGAEHTTQTPGIKGLDQHEQGATRAAPYQHHMDRLYSGFSLMFNEDKYLLNCNWKKKPLDS